MKLLVDKHGDDANIHAAMRSDELLRRKGNMDETAVWRQISGAINKLQNMVPAGQVHQSDNH